MVPVGKEYLSHDELATGPTLRSIAQQLGAYPESVSQPNAETVQASDAAAARRTLGHTLQLLSQGTHLPMQCRD